MSSPEIVDSEVVDASPTLDFADGNDEIESTLVEVVVKHTGYPADFIEMDQDLEGELGIDTVKQAEIMAEVREIFNLPVDEDFVLSDHPTLNHFTAYIMKMTGASNQNLVEELHTQTDEPLSGDGIRRILRLKLLAQNHRC